MSPRGRPFDQGLARVAQAAVLLAVDRVGAQGLAPAGVEQRGLDGVLDLLDAGQGQRKQPGQHAVFGEAQGLVGTELGAGAAGGRQGLDDLERVEGLEAAVALHHLLGSFLTHCATCSGRRP